MSEENVEVVRRFFPGNIDMVAIFRDPEALAAIRETLEPFTDRELVTVWDPDAIPVGTDTGANRGAREVAAKGTDGFLNFWRDWLSAFETWTLGPPEFIDVDADRVLVSFELRARSKTAQVDMTLNAANLVTLRNGKLTRLELFLKREEALESAGLSE